MYCVCYVRISEIEMSAIHLMWCFIFIGVLEEAEFYNVTEVIQICKERIKSRDDSNNQVSVLLYLYLSTIDTCTCLIVYMSVNYLYYIVSESLTALKLDKLTVINVTCICINFSDRAHII